MNLEIPRSLSSLLQELDVHLQTMEAVCLSDILDAFHERGFGVFLFFLALPMGLPIPVPPGVNVLLAMPLILLTAQQAYGAKRPWFPKKMRYKSLSAARLRMMIGAAIPLIHKVEYLLRPRLAWVTHGVCSYVIGVAGLLMALSICVPLPLTNTVPSFGIALMAAGVLMRDGLAVLIGMITGLAWVAVLLILGEAGLRAILSMVI